LLVILCALAATERLPASAGLVAPGTASVNAGTGAITFNGSSGEANNTLSVAFASTPSRYVLEDSGGVNAGPGCSTIDATTVQCPRSAAIEVTVHVGQANGSTDISIGSAPVGDMFSVIGAPGDDEVTVGSLVGFVFFPGGDGDDALVMDDAAHMTSRTYTHAVSGSIASITRTNLSGQIEYQDVESVELTVGTGAPQTVRIEGVPAWVDITVELAAFNTVVADQVFVSQSAGDLDAIQGGVDILGGLTDTLAVYDFNNATPATYPIDGAAVDRSDGTFAGITYDQLSSVSVLGTNAGSTFDVIGSSANLALVGGSGGDVANIGDDLDDLLGAVTFAPGGGIDVLNVDDSGNVGPYAYTLAELPLQLQRPGSDGVGWDNAALEQVNLFGTDNGDTFGVQAWHPNVLVDAAGGDDEFHVLSNGRKALGVVTVDAGPGSDTMNVDNPLNSNPMVEVDGTSVTASTQPLVSFSQAEAFEFHGGPGFDTAQVRSTVQGVTYALFGGAEGDLLTVGPDLTDLVSPVSIIGQEGNDQATISDLSGPSGGIYEIRGNRIDRLGFPHVTVDAENARLRATSGDDEIRLLSTLPGIAITADGESGGDDLLVFAAGLAATGSAFVDGGPGFDFGTDRVRLYTGGTGATFSGNSIVTPGRHNVIMADHEQVQLTSTAVDADLDGCTDAHEVGSNANFGGMRYPADRYDYYDVTSPLDGAVDLQDTIAVLLKFGTSPGAQGYDVLFDRVIGPPTARWRSQQATGSHVGIDLADALANLQQFGHTCAS
jgi:hypothetical protein